MFLRLLIFVLLGVVVYRAWKSVLGGTGSGKGGTTFDPQNRVDEVDDIMVKDPVCGIYFPGRDGVSVNGPHGVLYFCSERCRDQYLAQQSKRS
jgi:YHS domain-containing protein